MSTAWHQAEQRLDDLLADRALFGLGRQDSLELKELLQNHPNADQNVMDCLVARCDLAMGIEVSESCPTDLSERIRSAGKYFLQSDRHQGDRGRQ